LAAAEAVAPDVARRSEVFLARVQPADGDGGFAFSPVVAGANRGGGATDGHGRVRFASYATATCDGLLARRALGGGPGVGTRSLVPPRGLPESALVAIRDRSVTMSGFAYAAGRVLVSSIGGQIDRDLADDDQAYLSQRRPVPGDEPTELGRRFEYRNADGDFLPASTMVRVLDMEIYNKGAQRWREVDASADLGALAEDDRVMVYVVRQDRNRVAGDPRSEGWVPARKVQIGEPVAAPAQQAPQDAQGLAGMVEQQTAEQADAAAAERQQQSAPQQR